MSHGGFGYFPGVALVISPGWPVFPAALVIFPGWPVFPAALVISHGGFGYFPRVALVIFPPRPVFPAALVIFPGWLRLFFRGGSGYFPGVALVIFPRRPGFPAALVISHGGFGYFPRVAPVIFPRRPGYFPEVATQIIVFWTYFYLYKKICPNNFYFWTYELQISLFMSKFHLNFAVFKHISVVLDLYSHFFGHKILFIPDYVQTPSITSIGLSNIHKLIYCTE